MTTRPRQALSATLTIFTILSVSFSLHANESSINQRPSFAYEQCAIECQLEYDKMLTQCRLDANEDDRTKFTACAAAAREKYKSALSRCKSNFSRS